MCGEDMQLFRGGSTNIDLLMWNAPIEWRILHRETSIFKTIKQECMFFEDLLFSFRLVYLASDPMGAFPLSVPPSSHTNTTKTKTTLQSPDPSQQTWTNQTQPSAFPIPTPLPEAHRQAKSTSRPPRLETRHTTIFPTTTNSNPATIHPHTRFPPRPPSLASDPRRLAQIKGPRRRTPADPRVKMPRIERRRWLEMLQGDWWGLGLLLGLWMRWKRFQFYDSVALLLRFSFILYCQARSWIYQVVGLCFGWLWYPCSIYAMNSRTCFDWDYLHKLWLLICLCIFACGYCLIIHGIGSSIDPDPRMCYTTQFRVTKLKSFK